MTTEPHANGRGDPAAAAGYGDDRRDRERQPCAERDHRKRGREDQERERVRHAGCEVGRADRKLFADCNQHRPVHGRARRQLIGRTGKP